MNEVSLEGFVPAPYVSKYVKTAPHVIDRDRFYYMLEVLPPCRWNRGAFIEFFHVSERLTENLVSWFARVDGRYYEMWDDAALPTLKVRDMFISCHIATDGVPASAAQPG